ncbi:kinase subunit of RNA polymerase II carboxy-terminal domain kinase I [Ceratobasidium sp. 392]|nr:kinase subunit of RNA polymerase II carboxy-terminal domain kinase I [Ceratobasidium sp. 392]
MLDEVWEPSRKRPRQDGDDFRREHLSYEHIPPPALPREHPRRTPDRHAIEPTWDRRRSSDSHWQHPVREQYQADPSTDDLEPSHDPSSRIVYHSHRTNGSSSSYHRGMSRSHHPRLERTDPVQRHDSREWIPRDAVTKRGDTWPPKQDEPRLEPSTGIGDRTWTASEGWTRENSKSAAAARASDSHNSPPPRPHIPQAKVYNRTSHHASASWRDTHDDDIGASRHHQTGGPSRMGEGWRERQIRRDRDNGRRFTDRREKGPIPQRRPPSLRLASGVTFTENGLIVLIILHRLSLERWGSGDMHPTPHPLRVKQIARALLHVQPPGPLHALGRGPPNGPGIGHVVRLVRARGLVQSLPDRTRARAQDPGPPVGDELRAATKKRKSQRGGSEYISSDKRVRRDRSADSNRQRSRRRSVSTTSTRSRSDSGESEKRRTEAAKRPVHRLPESSRNKALEISPAAPQRVNGFNQQKGRQPLSPSMQHRAPLAIPRNLASESLAEPPLNDGSSGPANILPLPTSAIPTGPRSMASALSMPAGHAEPPPPPAPAGKPISPITLKPPAAKAPSRTVKMFFPGDDEDEDAGPNAAQDAGPKANLAPPVKDAPTASTTAGPSKAPEFVASKPSHNSAKTSPTTSPSLSRPSTGSSPLQKTNGSASSYAGSHPSASYQNNKLDPSSARPISPDVARVVRDETLRPPAIVPLAAAGSMPPPASMRPRLNRAQESAPPAAAAPKTSLEPPPPSAYENRALRAVSSSSTPKRPDRVPNKPPTTVSDYQIICQVGEGTFGKVYKARSMSHTDTFVALKRIRMEGEKDGFPVTAMREIKLLQSLRHENVVNLHEMMVSKGNVFMVFEYMDHDLTGVLSQTQFSFTPAHLKSLCAQMLSGLAYLHQKGVIHRDMKGSNILLNNYGELKLADFGLARFYSKRRRSDYTNRVITLWYRPPELLLGATVYGPEVDMWSAGCIMLELFTTKPAFQGNDEIHQLDAISRVMGTPDVASWPGLIDMPWFELVKPPEPVKSHFRSSFNKYLSPAALDLAESLLTYDPNKRASAAQALEAPYFVSESPPPEKPVGLASIEGEWHEYESKREREKLRKKRKVENQQQ